MKILDPCGGKIQGLYLYWTWSTEFETENQNRNTGNATRFDHFKLPRIMTPKNVYEMLSNCYRKN